MNVFIYIKGECKLVTGGVDCDVTPGKGQNVPVVGGSYLGFNSAYDCVALEIYSQQSVFLCCFFK